MLVHPETEEFIAYTIVTCCILFGYIFSRLFWILRLPPVLGMLFCGVLFNGLLSLNPNFGAFEVTERKFAPFFTDAVFCMVLVRAGLEINFRELQPTHVLFGTLPYLCDSGGVALAAMMMGVADDFICAACIGCVMACVGDGLVIPKMMEMQANCRDRSRLPRLMFVAAPMEATTALTLFGVFLGFATPTHLSSAGRIGVAVIRLALTVIVCKLVAMLLSILLRLPEDPLPRLAFKGRSLLSGHDVEDGLLICGTAYAIFAWAHVIPNGLDSTGLLQPELGAIMSAAFIGNRMSPSRRRTLENNLARIWIVCSLVLFTVLGTKLDFTMLTGTAVRAVPLLCVGWFCRAAISVPLVLSTKGSRTCRQRGCCSCRADNTQNWMREVAFVVISGMPRATVQGALANAASIVHAFEQGDPVRAHARQTEIGKLAVCTLAICAPCGVLLLDLVASRLLKGMTVSCQEAMNPSVATPAASMSDSRASSSLSLLTQPSFSLSTRALSVHSISSGIGARSCGVHSPRNAHLTPTLMRSRLGTPVQSWADAMQGSTSFAPTQEVQADFLELVAGMPPVEALDIAMADGSAALDDESMPRGPAGGSLLGNTTPKNKQPAVKPTLQPIASASVLFTVGDSASVVTDDQEVDSLGRQVSPTAGGV